MKEETKQLLLIPGMSRVADYLAKEIADGNTELEEHILKSKKSLSECWKYVEQKAKELAVNGSACVDETAVYGWVLTFYFADGEPADLKKPAPAAKTIAAGGVKVDDKTKKKGKGKTDKKEAENAAEMAEADEAEDDAETDDQEVLPGQVEMTLPSGTETAVTAETEPAEAPVEAEIQTSIEIPAETAKEVPPVQTVTNAPEAEKPAEPATEVQASIENSIQTAPEAPVKEAPEATETPEVITSEESEAEEQTVIAIPVEPSEVSKGEPEVIEADPDEDFFPEELEEPKPVPGEELKCAICGKKMLDAFPGKDVELIRKWTAKWMEKYGAVFCSREHMTQFLEEHGMEVK